MTETWRLLQTWNGAPGWNMGVDEAFFLVPSSGTKLPTLRFYTWSPATLSLGYFQRADEVPNLERAEAAVRRLTGGGAIHHTGELTFSIAASIDHPLYAGPVRESYIRVHGAIAEALKSFGVEALERGETKPLSDRPATGMCFEHSSDVDLVWDHRKGVGSAQRRTRGRVLHHGSIKLAPSTLDESVAGIRSHAPDATAEEVAQRIEAELARRLDITLVEGSLTQEEEEHAHRRAGHFTSEAFLRRR